MYILTKAGKEREGAYSVINDDGVQALYLFENGDDAMRYAMMLEDDGYPEVNIIEVEDDIMLHTCEVHDYPYVIITENDIVIPPADKHDFI
jgi:hypothetical protein